MTTLVYETGRPAPIEDYDGASGPAGEGARELGLRGSVSVPIIVEDRTWGVMFVACTGEEPLPAGTEARLAGFSELVATAIANAEAQAALTLRVRRLGIVDTDAGRAAAVAASLCARFGADRAAAETDLAVAMAGADGVINATPMGMARYPGLPLPAELLRPALWVAEIVYFPLETELLRTARALGCRTLDGGGMAVFQAAEAFRLFTGITPDAERMRGHFTAMGA